MEEVQPQAKLIRAAMSFAVATNRREGIGAGVNRQHYLPSQ